MRYTGVRRLLILLLSCVSLALAAQSSDNLKLITWNIQDFGRTKSNEEIELMAEILRGYDVIAIQEVVAKDPAGAQAVARLADALSRRGAAYDYAVSNPTRSPSSFIRERYAFLWRTDVVELLGRPTLLKAYAKTIDREPFVANFSWGGKAFYVATLHARPHDKHPDQEIAALRPLMDAYEGFPLFVAGDFNLVSKHSVFRPWRSQGYRLAVENQPTTLRREPRTDRDNFGDVYSREADNILVPAHQVQLLEGGLLDVPAYLRGDLKRTLSLSDHVPVYVVFDDFR